MCPAIVAYSWTTDCASQNSLLDFNIRRVGLVIPCSGKTGTDQSERYDLCVRSVDSSDRLPNEGRNLVIVALVGTDLHIRIFDANGKRAVDKAAENELISGETLTALTKEAVESTP